MDSRQLDNYAMRLSGTGIHFGTAQSEDGGTNLSHVEALPWEVAIVMIMSKLGWRIVDGDVIESLEPMERRPDHLRLEP